MQFALKLIMIFAFCRSEAFGYHVTVDETQFHFAKSYLCRYGYLNEILCHQHSADSLQFLQNNARDMHRALVMFQSMLNLPKTGKIDDETMLKMQKPRCGNKDFNLKFDSKSDMFTFSRSSFNQLRHSLRQLTYTIKKKTSLDSYSQTVSNRNVESIVEKSFQAWLFNLKPELTSLRPNITIMFTGGNHDDSMIFDGLDGEQAHSFPLSDNSSQLRGHVHLDDDEDWSVNKLTSVLTHQIGHLFGLDHSIHSDSIMSPLMNNAKPTNDDLKNLRSILGIETPTTLPPPPPPPLLTTKATIKTPSTTSKTLNLKDPLIKIGSFKWRFSNTNQTIDEEDDDLDSNEILKLLIFKSNLIHKNVVNASLLSKTTTITIAAQSTTKTTTATTPKPETLSKAAESVKLCNLSRIDAVSRTESGGSYIYASNYVWHLKGLTKWRLVEYEGWPKQINTLFPQLFGPIDSATFHNDHYYFTKNESLWKYEQSPGHSNQYKLKNGYPKQINQEFPHIPFTSIDSTFSVSSSIYFFKDYEMWQSNWETNITGKMPFRTNSAFSWRNPAVEHNLNEPLAYINSNMSLYKFNLLSIPISQETLDIRYFLFDCMRSIRSSMLENNFYKKSLPNDDKLTK